jgi:putative tricarboxylic transport membrane protein
VTIGAAASVLLSARAGAAEYPDRPITFLAQAAPGSGFDTITRAVARTLAQERLVTVPMPVTNFPSSAAGMQTAVTRYVGNPHMLSFQSISAAMRYATGSSPYSHKDITPIARLVSDYYAVLVRADSAFQTLQQFLDALRANPRAFPLTGGQSDDRIFYGLLFREAGIDPRQINYVPFSGGGEASSLLLEGSAKGMFSTVSDVTGMLASGQMRGLAVSGRSRLAGELSSIPTVQEGGVNLEWQNYRYAMGGPNMPAEAVRYWQAKLGEMVRTPTWREVLARYRWGDEFMTEGVNEYLDQAQQQITEVARLLGIAAR